MKKLQIKWPGRKTGTPKKRRKVKKKTLIIGSAAAAVVIVAGAGLLQRRQQAARGVSVQIKADSSPRRAYRPPLMASQYRCAACSALLSP